MNGLKSKIRFVFGWPLTILSLLFIFRYISDKLPTIWERLTHANLAYLLVAIVIFFVYYFLRSILWKMLLGFMGHEVKYLENSYLFEMSELKRFIPGNVWSLLGRADAFNKIGVGRVDLAKALLFEIQLIILGCLIVSIFSFKFILGSKASLKGHLGLFLPISITVIFFYFLIIAIIFKKKYRKDNSFFSSLFLPGFSVSQKIILASFSTLVFFIFGLANFLVLLTVFQIPYPQVIVLSSFFTFALLIGYVSFITPMGLGIREGIVAFGLEPIITIANSSFFALYSRVILIVSELVYALLILLLRNTVRLKK